MIKENIYPIAIISILVIVYYIFKNNKKSSKDIDRLYGEITGDGK
jgi:hypothetical protein